MKRSSTLTGVLAACALALAAAPSQAATYLVNFLDNSSTYGVTATITTADVLNGIGGYDITNISGAVTGNPGTDAITGLIANPTPPSTVSCCGFNYDNVLFIPGPGHFDLGGVLFSTVGGIYNLYMNSSTDAELYTYGAPGFLDVHGTVTAVAVPEPAAWALMILGFGFAGAALRRRARQLA